MALLNFYLREEKKEGKKRRNFLYLFVLTTTHNAIRCNIISKPISYVADPEKEYIQFM